MKELTPTEMENIMKTLSNPLSGSSPLFKSESDGREEYPQTYETAHTPLQIANLEFSSIQENQPPGNPLKNTVHSIKIEIEAILGKRKMTIKELLELHEGSVISLDKLAGEPIEIEANGKLIALGEVVVVDNQFGIRIIKKL